MSLKDSWDRNASDWIAWARTPGHDSYWRFHRDQSFELLPLPGRRTLDIGCGEGRLSRDLKALGHSVAAVDVTPAMVAAAREADPDLEVLEADAAALPFPDDAFDLAIAFMSLQDVGRDSESPSSIRSCRRGSSRRTMTTRRSWSPGRTWTRTVPRTRWSATALR